MPSNPLVNPFVKAPEVPKGDTGRGSSASEIEDFLSSDDKTNEPEPKEEKQPKVDDEDADEEQPKLKDDDDSEDDEEEIKLKDADEDEEDEDDKPSKEEEISVPPKKKAILEAYPDFFKKFPAVEKMIYRDREYTEMFGSIEDAKELVARSEEFSAFEASLLSGNTEDVLKKVKEADPKAFDKIVDNYLEVLKKVDNDAFLDVSEVFSRRIIKGMIATAKKNNDEKLHDAAVGLHEYLFGDRNWKEPTPRVPIEKDAEKAELDKERQEFMTQKFNDARDGLQKRVDNTLRSTIADHIDPRGVMSAYEKKNAINDALNRIHAKIGEDKVFIKNLQRLWGNAFGKNFSSDTIDAIRKNYLGKSTPILNTVLKEIRAEVIKGKTRRNSEEEEKETTPREPRKTINAGRPSQQSGKKANERQPGESIQDFFARD